uniref:Coenzyme Q-binding protein COQ10 START domain-containing protein n=1 Tax=Paulinella chromatophora TaxID=39717 RepID=B1X5H7_PAUCH|nr:hypothetical protein PCC_0781 [Paulinella chromatophora]ACB43196.1 hypothetical protein PCC_0781 [Paulinella chromatophora]
MKVLHLSHSLSSIYSLQSSVQITKKQPDFESFQDYSISQMQNSSECSRKGYRHLSVRLDSNLAPDLLWNVITDYNNLSNFIPNLTLSNLLWRRNNIIAIDQIGSQKILGIKFSARVQLELTEYPPEGRLDFFMLKGDFQFFEGFWKLERISDVSSLIYDLKVQGQVGMPIALIENRIITDIGSNLEAIYKEAKRRSSN